MRLRTFRDWKDETKILLIRMWLAGAVCFFGGWGRAASLSVGQAYSINLIFTLALLILASEWLILRPIIKMAFNIRLPDPPKNAGGVLLQGFLQVIKVGIIVIAIVETYFVLNTGIITLFHMDPSEVPVPLEPILFGILYGAYFSLVTYIGKKIRSRLTAPKAAL